MYTFAWEAEFGRHPSNIPIIYTDPNASDFDGSQTERPNTVIVLRSCFHDSSDGQYRETCPVLDPSREHLSDPKTHVQNQDVETATDLCDNDGLEQTSESYMDIATAHEPMQHPPSRQSVPHSTIEINNPTNETSPQNELTQSRGGKSNLRPNPDPDYSEIYRY